MPPAHPPSSPPPQIPFTLRECHTLRLPSESTCFGNLRVCLRTESGKSSPFVALSSSNHASFELVKSRKTPYKIIQSGEERSANRSAKSKARERNLERKKKQNADSNGELNMKESSSSDNNSKKDASKDEETHNATDGCLEELIVSTDVIGGDGENWEDWSDPNSTAVEAVAVRRQTGSKVSYTLRISRRHHQGRERRKGKAAKAESEEKEDQEQNQETPVPTLQDAPTSTPTPNSNDSPLPEEPSNQTIDLNYAPLVLHLTYLPRNYVKTLTLLVSSNDSSSIRIYQPLNNNLGEFTEITDSHEKNKILPRMTDTFPSPILTLDSTFNLSTSSTYEYHAIVGCKNGYIRVISFNPQKNTEKFGNFYVDGPVSTVQVRGEGGGVRLLVGSLAGFACVYTREGGEESDNGEGGKRGMGFGKPLVFMVGPEDAVICIYEANFPSLSGTALFVGTHSGKIMVFDKVLEPENMITAEEEDAEEEKKEVRGEVPETPDYWNWKTDAPKVEVSDDLLNMKDKVEEVRGVEAVKAIHDTSKDDGKADDKIKVEPNSAETDSKNKKVEKTTTTPSSSPTASKKSLSKSAPVITATEESSPETSPPSSPPPSNVVLKPTYKLVETRQLPYPVHKFGVGDIDSDGINELVVLTKETIHVFKRDDQEIVQVCEAKRNIIEERRKAKEIESKIY